MCPRLTRCSGRRRSFASASASYVQRDAGLENAAAAVYSEAIAGATAVSGQCRCARPAPKKLCAASCRASKWRSNELKLGPAYIEMLLSLLRRLITIVWSMVAAASTEPGSEACMLQRCSLQARPHNGVQDQSSCTHPAMKWL